MERDGTTLTSLVLDVQSLRTVFHTPDGPAAAVDGVNVTLHRGRTLGLVGESGCGKSVTALSILRLIDDARASLTGRILLDGEDLLTAKEGRLCTIRGGKIGMVFQEPATSLNPVRTIGWQVAEAVRLHQRISRRNARQRVRELLALVRIPEPEQRMKQYPHELSGGLKQRVMIAMALAGDPDVLIADEPTTALDVTVQAEILGLLATLLSERRLALLLITHDLGVVAQLVDDIAVMYAGRIVEKGPVRDVFARPRHPYTAGLLASVPRIESDQRPVGIEGTVPSATEWPVGCRFAPRCPFVFDKCGMDPQVRLSEGEHTAACWLDGGIVWPRGDGRQPP